MRRLFVVLSLLVSSVALAAPARNITSESKVIVGSLLVWPSTTPRDPQAFTRQLSSELGVQLRFERQLVLGWYLLQADVDDEAKTLALVERAKTAKHVKGSAAEHVMRPFATPGDPLFQFMWHLDEIGAQSAWNITQGSSSNRVGIVDTGTAFSHEDLQGKRGAEFDFISDDFQSADGNGRDGDASDPGDEADCNGDGQFDGLSSFHGTHVAGTILAGGDNGIGVTGLNWNAKVVTGRALGRCGGTTVDIDEAVAWMAGFQIDGVPNIPASERVRVVNLSLGSGGPCDEFTDSVWNAVDEQGVVIVVAAGNDGNNVPVGSPANCSASLAVAAYGPSSGHPLASYSNFGPEIDIVAPGGDQARSGVFEDGVLSSIDVSVSPFQDREPYTFYEGTSMATPHVAGVVSLMLDANPALTVQDVFNIIKSNGDTCANCQGKPGLRADLAVAAAAGTTVTTQPGDSCAGTGFCSPGQTCNNQNVCDDGSEGEGEEGEGEEGEGEPTGECDVERGNMDCDNGDHCEEDDDGLGVCEGGAGDIGVFGLCDFDRDCDTGLCERGVCTVTCDDGCRAGYSCDDEAVPGGLCVPDSCVDDATICGGDLNCSYSADSRYVCASGPSNYGGCGSSPGALAPVPVAAGLLLLLRLKVGRRRRR